MRDAAIAQALAQAVGLERDARAYWQTASTLVERDAALGVVRLVTPVIRSLEQWMTARAVRATQDGE